MTWLINDIISCLICKSIWDSEKNILSKIWLKLAQWNNLWKAKFYYEESLGFAEDIKIQYSLYRDWKGSYCFYHIIE